MSVDSCFSSQFHYWLITLNFQGSHFRAWFLLLRCSLPAALAGCQGGNKVLEMLIRSVSPSTTFFYLWYLCFFLSPVAAAILSACARRVVHSAHTQHSLWLQTCAKTLVPPALYRVLSPNALPCDTGASASSHSGPCFLLSTERLCSAQTRARPRLGKFPQGKSWFTLCISLLSEIAVLHGLLCTIGNHLPHIFWAALYTHLYAEGVSVLYWFSTIPGNRSLFLIEDTLQPTLPHAQMHIFVTHSTNNKYWIIHGTWLIWPGPTVKEEHLETFRFITRLSIFTWKERPEGKFLDIFD